MKNAKAILAGVGVLTTAATITRAQSDIDPVHKFSWQENTGWMNWRDADGTVQGVRVDPTFLSGWVWGENIGWIGVGDGSPGGPGPAYTNASGLDYGVNVLANGDLAGFGWGENVGWINFDTARALGAQRARYDSAAGRFRGYAWGENIGWVNLDDDTHFVGVLSPCPADWNNDGVITSDDFFAFLEDYFAGDADFNGDGVTDSNDFFAFLEGYFAGCA